MTGPVRDEPARVAQILRKRFPEWVHPDVFDNVAAEIIDALAARVVARDEPALCVDCNQPIAYYGASRGWRHSYDADETADDHAAQVVAREEQQTTAAPLGGLVPNPPDEPALDEICGRTLRYIEFTCQKPPGHDGAHVKGLTVWADGDLGHRLAGRSVAEIFAAYGYPPPAPPVPDRALCEHGEKIMWDGEWIHTRDSQPCPAPPVPDEPAPCGHEHFWLDGKRYVRAPRRANDGDPCPAPPVPDEPAPEKGEQR